MIRGRTLFVTALVVILNNLGNLSLTWGMRQLSRAVGSNPLDYIKALLNPFVALGVAFLILWFLTRMAMMSWADLSFVIPVTATGYVVAVGVGKFFLHESVSGNQWAGAVLIMAGAALAGSSPAKTRGAGAADR